MNHHTARKKVKRHLTKRGKEQIIVTPRKIIYWWNVLNNAVFHGKLNKPIGIRLIRHHKTYAWAIPAKNGAIRITFQPTMPSRKLFLMVLVHEMVHAWDHLHDRYMRHGKHFRQWEYKIERTTTLKLKITLRNDEHTR